MAKTKAKRLLSLLLSLAMVMSLVVTPVYAADDEDTSSGTEASEASEESSSSAESAAVTATSTAVASIGETNYESLAAAVAAASSGDTIKLLEDVTLTANLVISVSLTLDLNSKTITTGSYYIQQKTSNTDLTVKNGTITGSASYILYRVGAGNVTLTDVTITNEKTTSNAYALYVLSQSGIINFTATNCTFTSGKVGAYISGTTSTTAGSTFSFKNCTMSGGSYGLNVNGSGSLNTVTVEDCTISGTASGSSALNIAGNAAGTVTVTNTGINAYSGATAVFIAYNAGAVTVELGDGNVVTGAVKLGNQQSATSVSYTLKVTGGCFDYDTEIPFVDPVEANDIGVADMATITGGYYKVDVTSVLPTGYACSSNSEKDGYIYKVAAVSDATYYTVAEDSTVRYHETLAAAIEANNGTIYVRKNVELDSSLLSTLASSSAVLATDTGVTLTYSGTLSDLLSAMGTSASFSSATVACSDITVSNTSTSGGNLTGGSGFAKSNCASYSELLASNYLFLTNTYEIVSADDCAAKIGYVGYATLTAAINSVYNYSGSTITLLKDVTESVMFVSPSVTFTLDLGGFTLTAADGYGYAFAISYTTAADGSIFSEAENSNVTIKNGTIVGSDSDYGVTTNGVLTNVTLALEDVTVTTGAAGVAVYLPAGGSTTISGCTITGGTGVQLCGGSLTIQDSETNTTTITATGEDTTATKTGDGGICDGAAVSIIERDGYQDITSVSISGGTYTSTYSDAVVAYNWSNDTESDWDSTCTISITSGTYSSDVNDYTTDTTAAVANGDETYSVVTTVENAVAVVYDASGNLVNSYTSLSDAFSNVTDGGTITLLANVATTGDYNGDGYYQVSKKTVTLDLNGKTLTANTTRVFGVLNGGSLTVKNGTVAIADDTSATYKQFNMVRGSSTFTATNVTFDANEIGTYAVYIASSESTSATVELTDCTFTDVTNAIVFDAGNTSTVTLTGCSYEKQPFSTSTFSTVENYTVVITENSGLTYESKNSYSLFFNYVVEDGGKIETESTVTVKSYYGDASLTVNDGGTVKANVKVNDDTTMTVNGGTVTGTITVAAEGTTEENAVLTASVEVYDITGGLLTISGGTITGQVKSSGTLIMTGGTVTDDGTGLSDGVIYITGGNVYVEGGTVTGTTRGFGFAGSGTIGGTITGGSITGSDIALMVRANSDNTVKVSGGSYTATNALYLANGDSTIFADGYSAYNTSGAKISSTTSGSVTLYKSSLTDKTVVVAPTSIILGGSSNSETSVTADSITGIGTSTLYVGVSASYISNYSTTNYPTTSLTYTDDDGETHGYIFAGWYEDSTGTTACTSVPSTTAYAKFVDADVLTVKGIVTYGSATDNDEGTNYWRFATGLDSFNYNYIGFQVKFGDATDATELVGRCYTKYTVTGADNYVFTPSMFGSSVYIATNVISDTSATTCTVRAYWTTMDGTSVYSDWYSYSIPSSGYVLTGATVAE